MWSRSSGASLPERSSSDKKRARLSALFFWQPELASTCLRSQRLKNSNRELAIPMNEMTMGNAAVSLAVPTD